MIMKIAAFEAFLFAHLLVLFDFLGSGNFAIIWNEVRLYIVGTMNCLTGCM